MRISMAIMMFLFGAIFLEPAFGQTVITGDTLITGSLGAGTTTPTARIHVAASSATQTVFQVSAVDETPLLSVGANGKVGLGQTPSANVDIDGIGDDEDIGLELRGGSFYPGTGSNQIAFGYNNSSNLRHIVRSVHSSTSAADNSLDFLIWNPDVSQSALPTLQVVSLVTSTAAASVHIRPAGTPDVELEVSDGSSTGGGTIHRAAEATHSSRELKTDIAYLTADSEAQAYKDVQSLKHATFRYKSWKKGALVRNRHQSMRRGLIYEDSPESIRGTGQSLVIDERVNNAEMAMKELIRRLEGVQAEVSQMGSAPR